MIRSLRLAFLLLFPAALALAGGTNTNWVQMTPQLSSPVPSGYGGLYTSSVSGRPTLIDSSGHSFTIGVGSSWVASAGVPGGAVIGDCWRDTTASNKVFCKESSGVIAQRSDAGSAGSFGSGAANLVLASPASGGVGPITLRALVAADLTVVLGGIYQPLDADLTALAALSSTGFPARTASNTWALRIMQPPAAGITITNPAGVAGDPTLVLANDLAALEGLSSTGIAVRSASETWVQRMLAAPAAGITITAPDGVSGNPTFALADDLAAVEGLASNGLAARTSTSAWTTRTITGPAAGIGVTNGDGVSGNPTLGLTNDLAALEALGSTGLAARTSSDTWAQRAITAGTGIAVTNGDGVSGNPTIAIDATVATLTGAQILTNKTIDCASNACTVRLASDVTGTLPDANLPTAMPGKTLTTATITAPAISAPVLSGSATGTYTLAGTPTITAPSISAPVLSGTATGTYTLAGTPTITAPLISSPTFSGSYSIATAALPGAMYAISGGTSAAIGAGLTKYLTGVNGATAASSFAVGIVGSSGTLKNMSCLTNTSSGSLVVTAQYYDGVSWNDSALTITSTATNGPVDNSHATNVSANYAIGFKAVASGGYAGNYVTCTVQIWPQ